MSHEQLLAGMKRIVFDFIGHDEDVQKIIDYVESIGISVSKNKEGDYVWCNDDRTERI